MANGHVTPNTNTNTSTKGPTEQGLSAKLSEKKIMTTNGTAIAIQPVTDASFDMDQLPIEILDIVRGIPDDAYVPMSRLVDRAASTCWSDLVRLLQDLDLVQLADPKDVKDRIAGEIGTPNDISEANRSKKYKLWHFAETHKRSLIKLLVLLQWSAHTEENKVTIALNFYFHSLRAAFTNANNKLDEWVYYLDRRQDAAPDLDTAAEMLARGRIANLPDLDYVEEKELSDKEQLAILHRLNHVLSIRMLAEDRLPPPFTKWRIHDGRVTFTVLQEFEISLSLTSEDPDAKFQVVDIKFNFRPAPALSQMLLDEILLILNDQLWNKGLDGSYQFLHDLTMSQKLKELHQQAIQLAQSSWAGNLRIQLHKRTLVVQYWTRRPAPKSWIEVTINSGRIDASGEIAPYPIPYLSLRWLRHGKLVTDHEIQLNLDILSFENTLNEVVACHSNLNFDGIYDKLIASPLFSSSELILEQSTSPTDCSDCSLTIQCSSMQDIQLTCDPVGGALIISPASERTNRLQAELARSKNIVEDFSTKFAGLRCGIAQNTLSKAIDSSTWRSMPGRKPSLAEVRQLFGRTALRAVFFRQRYWSQEWTLAASFGTDGDFWWLIHESQNSRSAVQRIHLGPIHERTSLPAKYFEAIARHATVTISLQTCQSFIEARGIKSVLPEVSPAGKVALKVQLLPKEKLNYFGPQCTITVTTPASLASNHRLMVLVKSTASSRLLHLLSAAKLDSYVSIDVEKRIIKLQLDFLVGDDKMQEIFNRLHYINDVTNCIGLVNSCACYSIQKVTSNEIVIDYHTGPQGTLGLALAIGEQNSHSKIRLLPEQKNPHLLIANEIQSQMADNKISLAERMKSVLTTLTMSLPMISTIQYIQGLLSDADVPDMAQLKLTQSEKWLRVHVMTRSMVHFAIHYFSTNPAFKHDDVKDLPPKLLVRLEIEPQVSNAGNVITWVVRPAIEEFESYKRPSFASQELKQRLYDAIFSVDHDSWIPEDGAVRVSRAQPYQLMIVMHQSILAWIKEAIEQFAEEPVALKQETRVSPAKKPNGNIPTKIPNPVQTQPNPPQQQRQLTQKQQQMIMQQRQHQAMLQQQQQGKSFPQQGGRPNMNSMAMNMQQAHNAGMGGNANMNMNMNVNMNGTSRVMTAQPQQMRALPQNAGRGRGQHPNMQQQQQQNRGLQQSRQSQPHQVINID